MRVRASALLACLVAAALGLSACGPEELASPSAAATAVHSGIRGVVLLGPTCAAQPVDASPCLEPYVARLVVSDSDGNNVAEVTSASNGTFQVLLAPGDYVINPMPADGGIPNAAPQSLTVAPDDFVDVEIDYDTGIR